MQKGQYTELISGKVRISAKVISPPILGHVMTWAKDCGVARVSRTAEMWPGPGWQDRGGHSCACLSLTLPWPRARYQQRQ